jgi:excisionase family DNA binding protein
MGMPIILDRGPGPVLLDVKGLLNAWFPGSFPPYRAGRTPDLDPEPTPEKPARLKATPELLPCGMVDLQGAAAYLGIPTHAVRRLCRLRLLDRFVRTNRTTWRFKVEDLDEYLKRFTFNGKRR